MRNFNCIFNHPCPIFCPINLNCTGNQVINPVFENSFAFFSNNDVGVIAAGDIIPLSIREVSGEGIFASSTTGAINLFGGRYEISYFAQGTVPANGNISVALRLNGAILTGSEIEQTEDSGEVVNMAKTIVFSTLQTGTLELVNTSADATDFDTASVFVRRL